jgi:oxygen-independent coproporphyrinogen-3 oxidase
MNQNLIYKYDVAAPRYTSYPTVPYWDKEKPEQESWRRAVEDAWETGGKNTSLYIHLPFCESLCTYCACNTRITKNHSFEKPYIQRLIKEWAMYLDVIGEMPRISELHLGGGTPTFFSPENLSGLLSAIRETAIISADASFSFEAHPANTTSKHLEALFEQGFRRLSLGVQDFNPVVQQLINRHQSEIQVKSVTDLARIIGYTSVNFDLIYGLPKQTLESITETIKKVIAIRPDRIAFYSYAHVPWIHPGQRAYTEADLPVGENKRALYEKGRQLLENSGYIEIGLDHFALPGDELLNAALTGNLHRNFMGYTEHQTPLLIGLGVSAISDAGTMLSQNEKTLDKWNAAVDENIFPFLRGHQLNEEDLILRKHILNIMCKGETSWINFHEQCPAVDHAVQRLQELEKDGLVELTPFTVRTTENGKAFLRNIALCFDARFQMEKPGKQIFSQTA